MSDDTNDDDDDRSLLLCLGEICSVWPNTRDCGFFYSNSICFERMIWMESGVIRQNLIDGLCLLTVSAFIYFLHIFFPPPAAVQCASILSQIKLPLKAAVVQIR